MQKVTLRCSCGHSWEQSFEGPVPDDVSALCPLCSNTNQGSVDSSSSDLPEAPEDPAGSEASVLKPGEMLAGFEILEEIARGGMGAIYKARQVGLDRLVALKVILPERVGSEALRRFKREVRAAALLSHPNIVVVYHTDLEAARPFLAMEYVPGIDLWRLVQKAGPRPVREACLYIRDAAQGLQHAYEKGLVHRDIKPSNLMVTPSPLEPLQAGTSTSRNPIVKILDMGLARVATIEDLGEAATSLTQDGIFMGTADYVSPEQAEDPRSVDTRSDLFSLGGALYYLLVGDVPHPGGNLVHKLRRLLTDPIPSAMAQRPEVPAELDAIVQKMLAREPANRFQTPAEVVTVLDAFLSKSSGPAPRLSAMLGIRPTVPTPPAPASRPAAMVVSVPAHPSGVRALTVTADGQCLLSGGQDETLRLWDASRLQEMTCIAGDVGPVQDACLAPGGKWAASCALRLFKSDMVVQLWDLASGRQRRRLRGHEDSVCCVTISPDGRRVAGGSADKTIRIWTLEQSGSTSLCLKGHSAQVTSVQFTKSGEGLLSGSHDGAVRLWDARTGAVKGIIDGQVGKVQAVALHAGTKRMAIAGTGLRLRQRSGSMRALNGHRGGVQCVAFSPSGQVLLSGGCDGTVRLWTAADGHLLHTFEGHSDTVFALVFSPDGQNAYSGGADGTLRRWILTSHWSS
jgi:eukaryotic-like serine/threonine-protein kinase